jgi:cytoskeletal protein CcmA (bactofilin family)
MKKQIINSMVKLGIALCLLSVMVLGSVSPVQAAEFNENGAVPAGKTVDDDLFLTGQNVVMAGTVNGTLFVSGETINISGTVNGDVFAGGRIVVIEKGATITGNLFVGAAQIRVNGEVGGTIFGGSALMVLEDQSMVGRNVFYGGFSYEMAKNSLVKIDQFLAGRQVVLNGTTGRDVNIAAVAVEINGTVGGDANIEVEQPGQRTPRFDFGPDTSVVAIPSGLRISPDASIEGKLTYTSPVNQSTALQGNLAQPPVYQTPVPEQQNRSNDFNQMPESIVKTVAPITASGFAISLWFVKVVREFLTLFILGCLALWLLPKASVKVSSVFKKQLFPSFGYGILVTMIGFIALFIVPVLFITVGIFLSAVSLGGLAPAYFGVVGLALTLIAAIFLFLVFTGSMVVGSYSIGEAILAKSTSLSGGKRFLALLIGVLIIAVTTAIPFLGGLWGILVAMTGMGAFWRAFRQSRNISTTVIQ